VNLLSVLDARRQREGHLSFVVIKTGNSPLALCIESIFVDFEPWERLAMLLPTWHVLAFESGHCGCQGTVDFRKIDHDRSQVSRIDWIRLVGLGFGIKRVVPFGSDLVACFDLIGVSVVQHCLM
jgi:hypothetical protein